MQPYKELSDRIIALRDTVPTFRIMAEADVIHSNFHNWQKTESEMLIRWFALLKGLHIDPLKMKPTSSTYELVKSRVLTRQNTLKEFMKHGYSDQTAKLWAKMGDPRQVEAFKRVNEVVRKYELQLQKAATVS